MKYGNKKVRVGTEVFDSQLEYNRFLALRDMERCGEIKMLSRQPVFQIQINGVKICKYIADYKYYLLDGTEVIEDAKGVETAVFRLKKKLMKVVLGIDVKIFKAMKKRKAKIEIDKRIKKKLK